MIPHQIVTAVTTASYPPKGRSTNLAQVYKLEKGVQAQKSHLNSLPQRDQQPRPWYEKRHSDQSAEASKR